MTRRAFLALSASLLAACQTPINPSRSNAPTPLAPLFTPEPKPTATPALAGKPGLGIQTTPTPGPPKAGGSLTWTAAADPPDLTVDELVHQSLVMFDENLKLVPCLAEAWSVSDDRLTWTFKLRQGVTFHDGSELEAEDVRFWFERTLRAPAAAPYQHLYSQIAAVATNGKYEVTVELSVPHAPLLATFAGLHGSAIAPRRAQQGAGGSSAVGSGPYKVAEYVPLRHIRYVRHGAYWERGLPYLDTVTIEIVPDEQQRIDGLRAGRVGYAAIGSAAAQQLRRDLPILSSPGPTQHVTVFNTQRKPFDDVRVRQAIDLILDRQAALKRVLGGEGRVTGPVPFGHGEWGLPPESMPYRLDVTLARRLLEEAGHERGFETTIRTAADAPAMLDIAQVFAEQVRALGITLRVDPLPRAALVQAVGAGDFDLAATEVGFLPDPDAYFLRFLTRGRSAGPTSNTSWSNARYDELVELARATMDPGARKNLYDEATGIVLHEAPAIWWFSETRLEALHPSVKGYRPSFTGRPSGLKKTWLSV